MLFFRIVFILSCLLVQSCTQVDNYILGKDNTPKPKLLPDLVSKVKFGRIWSTSIGKANKTPAYLKLKPVIKNNVIYTADVSGMVRAIGKRDGRLIWSTQIKHAIVSGPTVHDGCLAVGTDSSTVVLLNMSDGQIRWEAHLSEDALSKAVIADHQLIVKTIDGNLYAFDLISGKRRWITEHGAPSLILKASSSPVVMGPLILTGYSDGRLDAVELNTGRLVWQRSIAYATGASDVERLVDIDADPIVRDNKVYLASYQGYIGALSLENGQFIWNKPGSVYKNMALRNGTLYVTDSRDVLWAFDSETGRVKWKQTSLKARGLTEPILMNQWLIVGDRTGYLHVLAVQNGEIIGRELLKAGVDISPAVDGDKIFVPLTNGELIAFSIQSRRTV